MPDKPSEGAFDDPAFGQNDEALQADRTEDGLQYPAERAFDPVGKVIATVGTITEDHFQPSVLLMQFFHNPPSSRLILPIRPMNQYCQYQSEGVHGQVPLATGNFFASVIAPFLATFRCADRLAVDNRHGGRRLFTSSPAYLFPQGIVDLLPNPLVSPLPKDAVNRIPIGKVARQHPPLATRANHVQDRIDHPTSTDRFSAPTATSRQQLSNNLPLPIRQITGIIGSLFHRYGSFLGWSQKKES